MTSAEPVTNSDLFLWALYELGGDGDFIHVETVFFRAFELAPQRLSWKTREDLPDLKKCSKGLRDAEARKPALLVKNGPELRKLSAEGQQWIEGNFARLAHNLDPEKMVRVPRHPKPSRLVSKACKSSVFAAWTADGTTPDEKWEVADFFGCAPDSSRQVWGRRIEEMRSAAYSAGRPDLLDLLDSIKTLHEEWF